MTPTTDTPPADAPQTQSRERAAVTNPGDLHLFYNPPGTLRLTVGDGYSFPTVRLYQSAPLSNPGKFLAFQDGKGEEIALVPAIDDLPDDTRQTAHEELRRRYLTSRVESITGVKTEFGVTYWNVITDRGPRDFVIQSLSESCVWLSESHIMLIDVDGNRFEIPDRYGMDAASRARLEDVL